MPQVTLGHHLWTLSPEPVLLDAKAIGSAVRQLIQRPQKTIVESVAESDCWQSAPAVSWTYEPGLPRDDFPLSFCPDPVWAQEIARNRTADRTGPQRIQAGLERVQVTDRSPKSPSSTWRHRAARPILPPVPGPGQAPIAGSGSGRSRMSRRAGPGDRITRWPRLPMPEMAAELPPPTTPATVLPP